MLAIGITAVLVACGEVKFAKEFDPDAQLAEDIAEIEAFIFKEGYTDYDTLESEVRVIVLEEGTGAAIEYDDIIFYDYIGRYIDSVMFDTSIGELALAQDQEYAVDTTYLKSKVNIDRDSLDADGNRVVETVEYEEGYYHIYSTVREYQELITVHTPGGWYIQQGSLVGGFKDAVNYSLEKLKLGGRVLAFLPSVEAYGTTGAFPIGANTPISFEIIAVRKK